MNCLGVLRFCRRSVGDAVVRQFKELVKTHYMGGQGDFISGLIMWITGDILRVIGVINLLEVPLTLQVHLHLTP